jgi:hypothetical protein
MAKKFGKGDMVTVGSGRHSGKRGVVTGHETGWVVDKHLVKLEGVDRPVPLSANVLRAYTPPPPSGSDAWIPGRR